MATKSALSALPPVTKLANNIIRILGCNPGVMTLQGTNTYLVGNGKRRILIDSGQANTAPLYIKLLQEVLREENASIQYVLLSHWHGDHIGGVSAIRKMLEAENVKAAKELTVLKLPRTPLDDDFTCAKIENTDIHDFTDFEQMKNDQCIEVEGAKLLVKHTPGHATDHACFLLDGENALFSGDCILGEGTAIFEDLTTYLQSLHQILDMKPSVIYPGHGPVISVPIPRIRFYIDHREKRDNDILQVLKGAREPMSEIDIVGILYKDKSQDIWPAAAYTINHHLRKLAKENRVIGDTGSWRLNEHKSKM